MPRIKTLLFLLFLSIAAIHVTFAAETPYGLNLDVQEFTLENGMLFLVVERPVTPQVACRLAIRAGSALENQGKSGIAHLLEHMMFKGTKNFGTLDPERDKDLQEHIEALYQVIRGEEQKRDPDKTLIRTKREEMERLRLEVQGIYVPQAFSSQLGRNGATGVNAFTTKDQTQYIASVPSDMIEQWFSIVSEQLFEPSWREFYVEKEVVQREWAYRYVNNPNGAAALDLEATAYTAHPYRNPVIGWKADMETYSTEDAVAFHEKYYNPINAVCVLVGDVTLERARELARIYFERYPAGRRSPERVTLEPTQQGPRRSVRFLKGARTPLVRIGFHGAPMGTRDFYALDALTMILSHGRSARITQEIVDKGLALNAWAYNPDNRYGGMVVLGGSPNEPQTLKDGNLPEEERREVYLKTCEELEKLLLAQVDALQSDLVTDRELLRIKKLNHRGFLDGLRNNEQLASHLATLEVQIGWRYLLDYLKEFATITPEEIRQAARHYLKEENMTSVFVIPGGTPDHPPEQYAEVRSVRASDSGKAQRPQTFGNISRYPTPPGWRHPLSFERKPEKVTYPEVTTEKVEGATVFYLPDRELPLIDLTILVKAGSVDVEDARAGLTGLLGDALIRGGTEKYSPQQLAAILDENAIQMSMSLGEEEGVIQFSVMKEDWDKGLSLLQEVLTRPRFDPEILQTVKEQSLTALQRQSDNAQAVANREAEIWHFKGHPYGQDPLIALKTLPGISTEDLRIFLETYFKPSNMVVAVAGDIGRERVLEDLRDFFKAFPQQAAPARNLGAPSETPPVLTLIHKPGQVQSQVMLMLPSVPRTHPDYWKIHLLMSIFGGNDSLLYKRLRDDLGLVYATYFFQTYRWRAGILMGYIGCKGDKTAQALDETVKIMENLRRDVPKDDLEQQRLDALNSFVFNVDSPSALVEAIGHYALRGEPLDTLDRIQEATLSVKKDELEALALRFLDPARLQVFVVADKTIPVKGQDHGTVTLEDDLKALAVRLGLPYQEMAIR